jgi:hypothetical protein
MPSYRLVGKLNKLKKMEKSCISIQRQEKKHFNILAMITISNLLFSKGERKGGVK